MIEQGARPEVGEFDEIVMGRSSWGAPLTTLDVNPFPCSPAK